MARFNENSITNLSTTTKDIVNPWEVKKKTTLYVIWLNYTFHGQSELFTAVR